MTFIPVEYHGVHTAGPEEFSCVLLRWVEQNRVLPLWISPIVAAELDARESGYSPRRPSTHEVLAETLTSMTSGVAGINLVSAYEGTFIASILLNDGEEIDARASDAVMLARLLELDIQVDEDVLTQNSFFASDMDLKQYFDYQIDGSAADDEEADQEVSASGDAQADADFSQLMESLGFSESELLDPDAEPGGADDDDGENRP